MYVFIYKLIYFIFLVKKILFHILFKVLKNNLHNKISLYAFWVGYGERVGNLGSFSLVLEWEGGTAFRFCMSIVLPFMCGSCSNPTQERDLNVCI